MSWTPFLPDSRYGRELRGITPSAGDRESIVLAFVCLAYVATTAGFGDPPRAVAWAGLGAVLLGAVAGRGVWAGWALVAVGLALGIAGRPFAVANHHFVLTWSSLALALALSAPAEERVELVRHNARWLIVAIMGFAAVHKLISPEFMSGSFLTFGIVAGSFGEPLLRFCGNCAGIVEENRQAIAAFRNAVPDSAAALPLRSPIPDLTAVVRGFGVSILIVEAALFGLFLFAPRSRAAHFLVLAFAAGLGIIRQELVFIAVVVALGYLSCPHSLRWLKRAYLVAAVVFTGLAVY